MSRDVIQIHGQDVVVREDTAKAFRGIHWALWSMVAFVVIAGILSLVFIFQAAADGKIESPSQIQNTNAR